MNNAIEKPLGSSWEKLLVQGELQQLNPEQRAQYYLKVCESLGLNHLTRPFDYITLNGKLTLYARKDCTDQLRKIHMVSIKIVGRERLGDIYVVTAQASLPTGRTDESVGAVPLVNLKGDNLANAFMKCETKAKRRVTLSICGMGIVDESEVDTIANVKRVTEPIAEMNSPSKPMTVEHYRSSIDYLPGIEPRSTAETYVKNIVGTAAWQEVVLSQTNVYRNKPEWKKYAEQIECELQKYADHGK